MGRRPGKVPGPHSPARSSIAIRGVEATSIRLIPRSIPGVRSRRAPARVLACSALHGRLGLGPFWVCGHRVPCHRLIGTFVACNSRHLKSWVANSLEGPFWTNVGQTKYCRDFSRSGPIAVPHVSISPFHVSSSVSICVAIRCNGVTPQWCTIKI
jgi:hypothetical protein